MKQNLLSTISFSNYSGLYRVLCTLGLVAFTSCVGQSAYAGASTWSNSGTDWNTGADWSTGLPTTVAVFSTAASTQPNVSATTSLGNINFGTAATGYDITATNSSDTITLTGAGALTSGAIYAANTSGTNTIAAPIILSSTTAASFDQVSGGTLVISGSITGTSLTTGLTLSGGGTVTLSGSNNYTGGTSLATNETLNINNNSALGSGGLTLGTTDTIDNTSNNAVVVSNNIANANINNFTFNGSNNLTFGSGAVNFNATRIITLNNGAVLTFGGVLSNLAATGQTFTVNKGTGTTSTSAVNFGGLLLATGETGAVTGTINGTGNVGFAGAVTNGTGGKADILKYSGSGTLSLLSGASTYSGGTTLSSGTLVVGGSTTIVNGGALTSGPLGTGALAISSGATINDNGTSVVLANSVTTGSGATVTFGSTGSGSITFTNTSGGNTLATAPTFALTAGATFTVNNNTTINDVISGGTSTLTQNGSGTLTLSGVNTYTGQTSVSSGTLAIGSTGSLASTSSTSVSVTGGTFSVAGTVNGGVAVSGGKVTEASTGLIGGVVNLNASGVSLAAAGTVNGLVTVGSGATLSGTGSLAGGAAINGGGNINLQDGNLGMLTVAGLSSGNDATPSSFSFDIGSTVGSTDLIKDTGTLTLNGTTSGATVINIDSLTSSIASGSYVLLTYSGAATGLGNISLASGSTTLDGKSLSLSTATSGEIILNVSGAATNGQYTLATSVTGAANVHASGGTTTLSTTIKNTGTTGQDTLGYSSLTATTGGNGSVGTGSNPSGSALALGATSTADVQTYTAGATTGAVTIGNSATVNNTTASGTPVNTPANTGTTVYVYSGQSTWAGTGASGVWGTGPSDSNFGVNWGNYQTTGYQGSPGVTSGFTGVDTAAFGNVSSHSAVQVNLAGATPNLNSITFNAPATSYTIGGGSDTGTITLSGTTPSINVSTGGGSHTIAAPVVLGSATSLAVASGQQLAISGQISGGNSLSNTGAGTTILSNPTGNTYSGGTAISAGIVYANNTSGSATGTGNVTVGFGDTAHSGTLAGSGNIGNNSTRTTVSVSGGGTISSGPVQTGAPGVVTGHGLTFTNTTINVSGDAPATLSFALGTDTTSSGIPYDFAHPSTNSTFMTLASGSTLNFTGVDSVSLTDLTSAATLSLRQGVPYLLVQATSGLDTAYTGLITASGFGPNTVYSLDGNGYVVGVETAAGIAANYTGGNLASLNPAYYTPIAINEFGPDGVTPLSGTNVYASPALYLNGGDLEVVPEPGTWALMLGGLGLLVLIQRRRSRLSWK